MWDRSCVLLSVVCLAFAFGCMGPAEWTPGDQELIRETVANISDARANSAGLAGLFTEDALPDKQWLQQTEKRSFVVEDVKVNGDTATLNVTIENYFGEVLGNQNWTCQKIDDKWKISAAPLP